MNIGNIEIKKAFLGSLPLNSKNAYIGNYKLIKEDEPIAGWQGLAFTALADNALIGMIHKGTNATTTIPVLQYSLDDGKTWNDWFFETITLNTGDKVCFRGDNASGIGRSSSNYSSFTTTNNVEASGNIMSVLSKENFDALTTTPAYCFRSLFSGCTKLINAGYLLLPATTLASFCYFYMFYNCTSLTTVPELPATTLASSCYSYMFYNCTSLTTAPELPATTLASSCYYFMFYNCTSLTTAPELPATTLASSCYSSMFSGCSRLTTAPALPVTTLASSCYSYMFNGCTNLTTAPALPATTLASSCYSSMFNGCTNLTTAPELPATRLVESCYLRMFYNCTSLTTAPELPATRLVESCYYYMFNGCSSLSEVTTHITSWNKSHTTAWLYGVSSTGTFYNLGGATIPTGTSGIPEGWTIETTKP